MCVMVVGVVCWVAVMVFTPCGVVVVGAVIAPHVLQLLPLHCVWCCSHPFCAMWGVAGAFIASGVVLWLWLLCHTWCMQL